MRVAKKFFIVPVLLLAMLIAVAAFPGVTNADPTLSVNCQNTGVVDKSPGASFTAKIEFKNIGIGTGNWSVNIAFEGASWSWQGTPQVLTLNTGASKTLTWTGMVPSNATIDSTARLVAYYNGNFKALDWWIHVVSGAELSIGSSSVS